MAAGSTARGFQADRAWNRGVERVGIVGLGTCWSQGLKEQAKPEAESEEQEAREGGLWHDLVPLTGFSPNNQQVACQQQKNQYFQSLGVL
jgi:protein tyrosine phosphatase (PTP) superfamily phosphohydrolase (DUF442 family)